MTDLASPGDGFAAIETGSPIWDRFFTVAPLILVGTTCSLPFPAGYPR